MRVYEPIFGTQVFLAQGMGVGIACGVTYVPGFGLIPHYFQRRRALAMGIVSSVSATWGLTECY